MAPWLKFGENTRLNAGESTMVEYLNRPDWRKLLNIPDKVRAYEGCTTDKDWKYNF